MGIKHYRVAKNPDSSVTRVCLGCGRDFTTRDLRESLCDRCDRDEPFQINRRKKIFKNTDESLRLACACCERYFTTFDIRERICDECKEKTAEELLQTPDSEVLF